MMSKELETNNDIATGYSGSRNLQAKSELNFKFSFGRNLLANRTIYCGV